MKKIFTLMWVLCSALVAFAAEKEYDFSTSIPAGWTASETPRAFETANTARGAQFLLSSDLTLTGVKNVTSVVITCSTNQGGVNSITVKVGDTVFGTESLAKEANVDKTFAGTASDGNLVVSITRKDKSVYIKKIVVTGDIEESEEEEEETGLDDTYVYDEPTIVTTSGVISNNTPYSFIQSNIKVSATTGAQADTYFGCNAGQQITFTATKNIKAVVINGYVKKDFEATASSGEITFVDATNDDVEATPVLIVKNVDSNVLTLECLKQLRCYNVSFYFSENPEIEIADVDDDKEETYTWDFEPQEVTVFNLEMDKIKYSDYSADLQYDCMGIYLSKENYELNLIVFAPFVEGTVIASGTYNVTSDYTPGTVQASVGGNDYYDFESFLATNFYEDGGENYYTTAYYIEAGTLTVSEDPAGVKMVLNATTHFGSTINATYVGAIDDTTTGISEIESTATSKSANGKFIKNGRLVIIKNGKTYNAQGMSIE